MKKLPKLLSINLNLNLSTLYRISGKPQKCHWVPSVQLAQVIRVLKEDFQVPVKLQQKQNYHTSWSNNADTKFKVQSSKLDAISSRRDESRIKNIFCNTNNRVSWKFKSIKIYLKLYTTHWVWKLFCLSTFQLYFYKFVVL